MCSLIGYDCHPRGVAIVILANDWVRFFVLGLFQLWRHITEGLLQLVPADAGVRRVVHHLVEIVDAEADLLAQGSQDAKVSIVQISMFGRKPEEVVPANGDDEDQANAGWNKEAAKPNWRRHGESLPRSCRSGAIPLAGRYARKDQRNNVLRSFIVNINRPRKTDGLRKLMIYGEGISSFVSHQSDRPSVRVHAIREIARNNGSARNVSTAHLPWIIAWQGLEHSRHDNHRRVFVPKSPSGKFGASSPLWWQGGDEGKPSAAAASFSRCRF